VRRPRLPTRAPVAVAALLSVPLFFAALLAVSLAIERPHRFQWRSAKGRLIEIDHSPTSAVEAKIWALALVLPAALIAVGLAAAFWRRFGIYVSCTAGVVVALLLPLRLDRWTKHHTARFPFGMDLYPDSSISSTLARGEWERNARETVLSLTHWTIGLALAVAAVAAFVELRRRRLGRPAPVGPPPMVVTGEPEASPVVAGVEAESRLVRRGLGGRLFGSGR
jgi:energy-converting hydrogenase Eha subunit A